MENRRRRGGKINKKIDTIKQIKRKIEHVRIKKERKKGVTMKQE